jgi:isoquinoline 1-oxidoreductase beta subunit
LAPLFGKSPSGSAASSRALDSYSMLLIPEIPQVEIILMHSCPSWGGLGEPSIVIVAPAILSAIYAATAKLMRTLS